MTLVECIGKIQNCMCNTGFMKWVLFLGSIDQPEEAQTCRCSFRQSQEVLLLLPQVCAPQKGTDLHII